MSAELPDYYALLHVDPGAPQEVIRASYKTLMQRLGAHPDRGGDHESAAALNAAWATLRDPARRAAYDAQRVFRSPGRQRAADSAGAVNRSAADRAAANRRANGRAAAERASAERASAERAAAERAAGSRAAAQGGATNHDTAGGSPGHRAGANPASGSRALTAGERLARRAGSTHRYAAIDEPAQPRAELADRCPFCRDAVRESGWLARAAESCARCGAPLTLVRPVSPDAAERQRAVYRISRAEPLRVFADPQDTIGVNALVHDISVTGLRFSCARAFETGTVIRGECAICATAALIAHATSDERGMWQYGARFITVRFSRQRGSLLSVPV